MGWDVVGTVSRAASWWHDRTEAATDAAGDAIDGAVRSAEHAVDDARRSIVDFGERHGGMAGKVVAQNLSNSIGVVEGAGLAVYDAAAGLTTLARGADHLLSPVEWALHPERNVARAQSAGHALTVMAKLGSPIQWALQPQDNAAAATAVWNGMTAGYQDAARSGDWSKFAGRAVVDVGSFFIGAGEVNAAVKTGRAARVGAEAAEGLNALAHAGEGVAGTARAGESIGAAGAAAGASDDVARAAEVVGSTRHVGPAAIDDAARSGAAAHGAQAPAWFRDLGWSEPVRIEALRTNRALIPNEPGVYVFTKYAGPLEKNTGVLYVGKADALNTRLPSYLADPREVPLFSQKYGAPRLSSTLRHPGKSLLLMEIQQHTRVAGAESGVWVRWVRQGDPLALEGRLIDYLQPAFNTQGR